MMKGMTIVEEREREKEEEWIVPSWSSDDK
jgi:hypothetical protein